MKKVVGKVSESEKNEIQTLFERRNGLNELANILTADNEELYERLVKDLGETSVKFQKWWDEMSRKYQWESIDGGNWEINFDTCEIYLIGTTELLLIGGLALLLVGGKKLPEMMRGLGKGVREFKDGMKEQPVDDSPTDEKQEQDSKQANKPDEQEK